jgi:hypothetical protein
MGEVADTLRALDPRWSAGPPPWQDGGTLLRSTKRCVFGVASEQGIRCGLHLTESRLGLPAGALKPLSCRLFPLILVDLGEQRLLTAVHRSTTRLGAPAPRWFPCLRRDTSRSAPIGVELADTLGELFGLRVARAVARAVTTFSSLAA